MQWLIELLIIVINTWEAVNRCFTNVALDHDYQKLYEPLHYQANADLVLPSDLVTAKDILDAQGPDAVAQWVKNQDKVLLTKPYLGSSPIVPPHLVLGRPRYPWPLPNQTATPNQRLLDNAMAHRASDNRDQALR